MWRSGVALGLWLWGVVLAVGFAQIVSYRPTYLDPALGAWIEPLRTLCFQAGCGKLFYVTEVRLEDNPPTLHVVSRSKVTIRQLDRAGLSQYAGRLTRALAPAVEALNEAGTVERVMLTFYAPQLEANVLTLETFRSTLPAENFGSYGAIPLRVVDRRVEFLPPP
jgi:hypothetical protein